jgi:hypothetical protein
VSSRYDLVAVLFALTLLFAALRADDTDEALNSDLQRMVAAVKASDYDVAIDMMYSPVAEADGGREALKKIAATASTGTEGKAYKIISYDLILPYQRVSTPERDYVIIPVRVVVGVGSHNIEEDAFELAIRSHGTTKWEYLNGSNITPEMKDRYFPDLKDTDLPQVTSKMLY